MTKGICLPRIMRGLSPILVTARILGLAPYVFSPGGSSAVVNSSPAVSQERIEMARSKAYLLLTACTLVIQIVTAPSSPLTQPMTITFYSGNRVLEFILIWSFLAMDFSLPVFTVLAASSSISLKRCNRLLNIMALLDHSFEDRIQSYPRIVRKSTVITCMFGLMIFITVEVIVSNSIWNISIWQSIFDWLPFCLIYHISYLFCALALILKFYFETTNDRLWELSNKLLMATSKNECSPKPPLIIDTVHPHLQSPVVASTVASDAVISEAIFAIRETHFRVQEACLVLDAMFSVNLLLLFTHVMVQTVTLLYMLVVCGTRGQLLAAQAASSGAVAAANAALGAAVAWAAGGVSSAQEAAGSGGGPVAALLLALHPKEAGSSARPLAKHEAQLLWQQLLARPHPHFCAGGVFPIDLRFFVALLGSILGYLVVVVQFALQK